MRKSRSFVAFAVTLAALALTVAGCGSSEDSSSSDAAATGSATTTPAVRELDLGGPAPIEVGGRPLKIAFFLNSTTNAYALALQRGAREEAKRLGVELTEFDAGFDTETQINQMENALTQDYNAWAFQSVSQSTCALIRKAIEQGILVSIFNEQVCTELDSTGERSYLPGALNFIAGDQTTEAFANWLDKIHTDNPGPQNVLLVVGTPGVHQTEVTERAAKEIEKADPQFRVTVLQVPTYDLAGAQRAVQARLNADRDVTIIAGNYSDMTQGAVLAAQRAGIRDVKVYDMGGSRWAVEGIRNGSVQMTSPFLPVTQTELAIKSLYDAWHGREPGERYVNVLDTLDGEPFLTKENVGSFSPQY